MTQRGTLEELQYKRVRVTIETAKTILIVLHHYKLISFIPRVKLCQEFLKFD